jgi:hypothetical protein
MGFNFAPNSIKPPARTPRSGSQAAQQIGMQIPNSLLLLADRVIE